MASDPSPPFPDFSINRGVATYRDGMMVYLPLGPLGPAYLITRLKTTLAGVADYIFLAAMLWCVYALHMIGRPLWWAVGNPVLLMVLMRVWIFPTLLMLPTSSRRPTLRQWHLVSHPEGRGVTKMHLALLALSACLAIAAALLSLPDPAILIGAFAVYLGVLLIQNWRLAPGASSDA
jgi:hypothetical protein